MLKEIDNIIKQAIKENWYNEMTISDLQGVCEACAMGIYNKNHIDMPRNKQHKFIETMKISDQILSGVYDAVNPF